MLHARGELDPQAIQSLLEAGLVSRGRALPRGVEEVAQGAEHDPAPVSLDELREPRVLQRLVHRRQAAPQVGARGGGHAPSVHLA